MQIVTGIPSRVARAIDIVDRDIRSNLELHEQALFTLPPIGNPHQLQTAPVTNGDSFVLDDFAVVTNGASLNLNMATLTRGLWILEVQGVYSANFSAFGTAGLELFVEVAGVQVSILVTQPMSASMQLELRRVMLLVEDALIVRALAANGAGQSHGHALSFMGTKVL